MMAQEVIHTLVQLAAALLIGGAARATFGRMTAFFRAWRPI